AALQATPGVETAHVVQMHPATIAQHGLVVGSNIRVRSMTGPWVPLPLAATPHVPEGTIAVALGLPHTAALGPLYQTVEVASA
ncbi:hypothetical protein EBZ35_08085, partial [bacterium]|nr:hypothetical protein [bacterium]